MHNKIYEKKNRYKANPPTYMNMIRDPVERAVSMFFYRELRDGIGQLVYDDRTINNIAEVCSAPSQLLTVLFPYHILLKSFDSYVKQYFLDSRHFII